MKDRFMTFSGLVAVSQLNDNYAFPAPAESFRPYGIFGSVPGIGSPDHVLTSVDIDSMESLDGLAPDAVKLSFWNGQYEVPVAGEDGYVDANHVLHHIYPAAGGGPSLVYAICRYADTGVKMTADGVELATGTARVELVYNVRETQFVANCVVTLDDPAGSSPLAQAFYDEVKGYSGYPEIRFKLRVLLTDHTSDPNLFQGSAIALVPRQPLDAMVVLDRSGSMFGSAGSVNKWEAAKNATGLFVETMRLFNQYERDDKVGVVTYPEDPSQPGPGADLQVPLDEVPVDPDAITGPLPGPGGVTPMGTGLAEALNAFGPLDQNRRKMVLLLTDGRENESPMSLDVLHNQFPAPPDPWNDNVHQDPVEFIRTYPVGFGAGAWEDRLQDIADEYAGGSLLLAPDDEPLTLQHHFLSTLDDAMGVVEIPWLGHYTLSNAELKAMFVLAWEDPHNQFPEGLDMDLELFNPNDNFSSHHFTPDHVDFPLVRYHQGTAYSYYFIDSPPPGDWRINRVWRRGYPGQQPSPERYRIYCFADPRVQARFGFSGGTTAGEPIQVWSTVKEDGRPVKDAEVTVEVQGPDRGLGTVLATHDWRFTSPRELKARHQELSRSTRPADDPGSLRSFLARGLAMEGRRLGTVKLGEAKLAFDAGKKRYLAGTDQTPCEGAYTCTFTVRGKTAAGLPFARVKTISRLLGVKPDGGNTEVRVKPGTLSRGRRTVTVTVTPRDARGEYLGPGRADRISFSLPKGVRGELSGAVRDNLNGSYSQRFALDQKEKSPRATLTVAGKRLKQIKLDTAPKKVKGK